MTRLTLQNDISIVRSKLLGGGMYLVRRLTSNAKWNADAVPRQNLGALFDVNNR